MILISLTSELLYFRVAGPHMPEKLDTPGSGTFMPSGIVGTGGAANTSMADKMRTVAAKIAHIFTALSLPCWFFQENYFRYPLLMIN